MCVYIYIYILEKEMATHSSTLAWKIPQTEEAGRPQSMGSQRVGHDWATSLRGKPKTFEQVMISQRWTQAPLSIICRQLHPQPCSPAHLPLATMHFHSRQPFPAPLISLTDSCSSFKNHFPMEAFPAFPFLQTQQFEYSQPFKIMMLKNVSQLCYG